MVVAVGVVVLVIGLIGCGVAVHVRHSVTTTLCSKERAADGGGGEYRVYSADSGTYVIKDSHWLTTWRTDSADAYGRLHVPGTYRVTYIGWRASLFSWFHNIMSYKRLPDNEQEIARCNR